MEPAEVRGVVDLWRSQQAELSERYSWVQIFETRGAMSGASNPHPHGQIWASEFVPNEAVVELEHQRRHRATHGSRLLVEYAEQEVERGDRLVTVNEHWVVVVPYWAYWPYETLVVPRRPVASLTGLLDDECDALADILPTMFRAFDRVVRDAVSLLLRVAHGTEGSRGLVAVARPLLPPAAAVGRDRQDPGELRAVVESAARPHT